MAGGQSFAIVGALSAFPRRLAAREVARQGGVLRAGVARNVDNAVFGRTLPLRMDPAAIEKRLDAMRSGGAVALSENGFRRKLGLIRRDADAAVSRQSLIEQSRLDGRTLDLLTLFDCFESDAEPYSFRDVILARKYERLTATGASWADIARSVHRAGNVASLTSVALHGEGGAVFRRDGERLVEMDGQGLLPFDDIEEDVVDNGADELFAEADAAEQESDHDRAAALYAQYLTLVPTDAVAAFNRANALSAGGRKDDAVEAFRLALKLDPGFAEAWFNYGSLLRDLRKTDLAREHFARAIALDPTYADPIYNLAALEYEAGQLTEARHHWGRYLELDAESEWAKKAMAGIKLIDMTLNAERKRGA
jgi:tetratricopeptide (TPR) repeat protein